MCLLVLVCGMGTRQSSVLKFSHFLTLFQILLCNYLVRRSQWPRGLRRRSVAARLLRSWVRIPPGAWMFFCCECCVLSGRGLCNELITRPEESYRLWCVVVYDLENLVNEEAMTRVGSQRHKKKIERRRSDSKSCRFSLTEAPRLLATIATIRKLSRLQSRQW